MKRTLTLPDAETARLLFGASDAVLRQVRRAFSVSVSAHGNRVSLEGDHNRVDRALSALEDLAARAERGHPVFEDEVERVLGTYLTPDEGGPGLGVDGSVVVSSARRIEPKSPGQRAYVAAMRTNDVVLSIGPAGTGKTYLATAVGLAHLMGGAVGRMVLVRPAVEAGEKLGFLPGDLAEKVNPYLRPIYDALGDMLPYNQVGRYLEKGIIEVAPLAFMRGRTLNNAFVIHDEAQNTTIAQMKMFLTRLGNRSKAVVTGDVTQVDLPQTQPSGLIHAERILAGVEGIALVRLEKSDVVRHPLVRAILSRYELDEQGNEGQ
jgi:phosphate starvation-inducible protein PhoH and related proteins